MFKLGNRIRYIIILFVFGLILSSSQGIYADAKNSGRNYQYIYGHAYGYDLEYALTIKKGETRSSVMIPQFRYVRGVDGYSVYSLFTNDEFVDKYNKDFVKERKGYSMEAVAADTTIVQIINKGYGSYFVKGLKEGQTVIRFYETHLGVKHYLGCRQVIVGPGDLAGDTVTIFVGSRIDVPANWVSINSYSDGYDGTDKKPIPKDKSLFKKVVVDKDYYYYKAIKTGETTATVTIEKQKKTFKVKIVEPAISKNAKKEYGIYEGYRIFLDPSYGFFEGLFDCNIESTLITGISKNKDIVEVAYDNDYLYFVAKKSGKAKIDLYYKLNGKKIHLGQFVIKVLKNNNAEYINILSGQENILDINDDISQDANELEDVTIKPDEESDEIEIFDDDYIDIADKRLRLRVGDNYQFQASSSRDFDIKWRVSDTSIATIDASTGKVTAKKTGTVVVYAEAAGLFSSCYVTIVDKDAIIINGDEVITGERSLTYSADFDNVTWSVSDSSKAILQVEGNNVILYPIDIGTVILYAQSGSKQGQLTISIEDVGINYYDNYYAGLVEYDDYEDYGDFEFYEY
jgi:uncharacterized protein YjdB